MFYKMINITKISVLTGVLVYLLSSVSLAQTLDLANESENNDGEISVNLSANAEDASEDNSEGASDNVLLGGGDESNEEMNVDLGEASPFGNINLDKTMGNSSESLQDSPKKEEQDSVIKAYNNFMDEVDRQSFNNQENSASSFGDKIMDQVKEDLFSQMADIEKQTSLLTLELKREKIKNEIAAMHAQREKAAEAEREKQLEKERKQAEWEKEQERKLLEEQQKLKQLEIKYEKLRQERVLKAYKENMLKTNQEWVDYNSRLYNQLIKEEKSQNDMIAKQKEYFKNLSEAVINVRSEAEKAKEKYNQEIANLQTQVAILKSKLEAEKTAYEESQKTGPNPFALVDDENGPATKIAEEYAIMEISGKGDVLVAKLINKNGGTFMVKPGTILNTGHVVEEITQTYIIADKAGVKDYLYFSAGGILDKEPSEPIKSISGTGNSAEESLSSSIGGSLGNSVKIPNLRSGMFVE